MTHILITDLREIRYMAYVPEEPKVIDFKSGRGFEYTKHEIAWIKYRSDLEKAKRESLPFDREEDHEKIIKLIAHDQTILDYEKAKLHYCKPGIYQVPVEVEVVEIDTVEDGGGCYVAGSRSVARLKSSEPKPESQEFSGKEVGTMVWDKEAGISIKPLEESQEDIIQAFFIEYNRLIQGGRPQHSAALKLLDKFNVTRKRG